jgi:hypothetical protein
MKPTQSQKALGLRMKHVFRIGTGLLQFDQECEGLVKQPFFEQPLRFAEYGLVLGIGHGISPLTRRSSPSFFHYRRAIRETLPHLADIGNAPCLQVEAISGDRLCE